ncbi:MAG: amidohydrolase [Nocardioides sp.]
MSSTTPSPAAVLVDAAVQEAEVELVALRRDLHAHPELSWGEARTSTVVADRIRRAGWRVDRLPQSGVLAELGPEDGPVVALRADLDALPVPDLTDDPWSSTVAGVTHACGHDVHTSALVGAAIALARVDEAGLLPGRVRLLFQPAEEVMPGGALSLIAQGALADVERVFGLHCDPTLDVGEVGLREGPITGAADLLNVTLTGSGGHTSRPHLTEDLTYALGKVVTELPAILSRRLDPRAGVSVSWGIVRAGSAPNVIPATGRIGGTVRMLDAIAWSEAEKLVPLLIEQIVAPYGVHAQVEYQRGVPPVVNDLDSIARLARTVEHVLGVEGHVPTQQSLGGEDFGWYLDRVPGAMGRLGTRTPGGPTYDLHQGNLRIDERAVAIGARVLAGAALSAPA